LTATYVELLMQRSKVVELRAFNVGGSNNMVGRFTDPAALSREARRVSGSCDGVYTTLNPIKPEVLGMAPGQYAVHNGLGGGSAIQDKDISRRLWIPMDFDSSKRPKDRPASDEELRSCELVCAATREWLLEKGWPEPIVGMSGNGYHLLYATDLPADDETTDMVRRLFVRLALKVLEEYKDHHVKFDTVCFNLSRIWKLYGTLSTKGIASKDRPHRPAACVIPPELIEVTRENVLSVATTEPSNEKVWLRKAKNIEHPDRKVDYTEGHRVVEMSELGKGDYSTLDIVAWMESHDLYRFEMREEGKHSVYCPWAENHSSNQEAKGTDTVVWEADPNATDGERKWPIFHCSHESCGDTPKNPGEKRDIIQLIKKLGDADSYCDKTFEAAEQPTAEEAIDLINKTSPAVEKKPRPQAKPPGPSSSLDEPSSSESSSTEVAAADRKSPDAPPPEPDPDDAPTANFSRVSNPFAGGWAPERPPTEDEPVEADEDAENKKTKKADKKKAKKDIGSKKSDKSDDDDDDDDGGSPDSVIFATAEALDLDYLIENLVTIEGTNITYHIGRDWQMGSAQLSNSYPTILPKWKKSKHRQHVQRDHYIFDPSKPPLHDPDNPHLLNRFRGMPVIDTSKASSPDRIIDHVHYLCEDNEEQGKWFLGWMAYQIQNPGTKLRSAVIFKGTEGTGKNVLFDMWCKRVYGKYGVILDAEQLGSKYNTWAFDALFVLGNEISTSKDRRDIPNKLKHYITGSLYNMEAKFQDVIKDIPNLMNFLFLSNEDVPITMGPNDRRYAVFHQANRKDQKYYLDLLKDLNSGGFEGFYKYLKNVDVSALGFSPYADPPWNETKQHAIDERLPPHELFVRDVLEARVTAENREEIAGVDMPYENLLHRGAVNRQDLWIAFNLWVKEQNKNFFNIPNRRFYHHAREIFKTEVSRVVAVNPDGTLVPAGPGHRQHRRRSVYFFVQDPLMSTAEIIESSILFRNCLDANRFRDTAPPVANNTEVLINLGEDLPDA
jgi:hypothetical protein